MPDEMDIASKIDAEAKERAKLNEEAEAVMANSKPTPTQREADLIKAGVLHPDDKEDPKNPTMPPVEEQRRRVADAGSAQPYRTRDMGAAQQPAARHAPPAAPTTHHAAPTFTPAQSAAAASSQTRPSSAVGAPKDDEDKGKK